MKLQDYLDKVTGEIFKYKRDDGCYNIKISYGMSSTHILLDKNGEPFNIWSDDPTGTTHYNSIDDLHNGKESSYVSNASRGWTKY